MSDQDNQIGRYYFTSAGVGEYGTAFFQIFDRNNDDRVFALVRQIARSGTASRDDAIAQDPLGLKAASGNIGENFAGIFTGKLNEQEAKEFEYRSSWIDLISSLNSAVSMLVAPESQLYATPRLPYRAERNIITIYNYNICSFDPEASVPVDLIKMEMATQKDVKKVSGIVERVLEELYSQQPLFELSPAPRSGRSPRGFEI